jgi:hypothetical protein
MSRNKKEVKQEQVVRLTANYKKAPAYEERFTINYPAGMIILENKSLTFDELFKYLPNAVKRHDHTGYTDKYEEASEESTKPPTNKEDKEAKS